jgi:hypothetical protein
MLAWPQAVGKFIAAVPQSNLGGLKDGTYSLYRSIEKEVSQMADTFLEQAGCTSTNVTSPLECLTVLLAYTLASLSVQAETLVVDGTYIKAPELILNGSEPVTNVHLFMGTMCDEAGTAIKYPPTSNNFSTFIEAEGFNSTLVQIAGYTVPNTGSTSLDIVNASVRVDTDGEWRRVDQANVYGALQNDL